VAVDTADNLYVSDEVELRVVELAAGSNTQTVLPFTDVQVPGGVAVDTAAPCTSPIRTANAWCSCRHSDVPTGRGSMPVADPGARCRIERGVFTRCSGAGGLCRAIFTSGLCSRPARHKEDLRRCDRQSLAAP
jgi:hypothetical protein